MQGEGSLKTICPTAQLFMTPKWKKKIENAYVVDPNTGCWEWTGTVDRYGYGRVSLYIGGRRKHTGAHRASWIVARGPILGNLTIDHRCLNKLCVNPWHLEPVTNEENVRRAYANGQMRGGQSTGRKPVALKDRRACKHHGTTDGAWATRADGYVYWRCRPCGRRRLREWYARQSPKCA